MTRSERWTQVRTKITRAGGDGTSSSSRITCPSTAGVTFNAIQSYELLSPERITKCECEFMFLIRNKKMYDESITNKRCKKANTKNLLTSFLILLQLCGTGDDAVASSFLSACSSSL